MSVHTTCQRKGIYFITFTCHNWMHLIHQTNGYDLLYKWFDVLKMKGHAILGYVIMPNHVHVLLFYSHSEVSLNMLIGNGKRFMAYEMVRRLEEQGKTAILAV
jgi:REP element-mobilizing transposase RayT